MKDGDFFSFWHTCRRGISNSPYSCFFLMLSYSLPRCLYKAMFLPTFCGVLFSLYSATLNSRVYMRRYNSQHISCEMMLLWFGLIFLRHHMMLSNYYICLFLTFTLFNRYPLDHLYPWMGLCLSLLLSCICSSHHVFWCQSLLKPVVLNAFSHAKC